MSPRAAEPVGARVLLLGSLLLVLITVVADQLGLGLWPGFHRLETPVLGAGLALVIVGLVTRGRRI